MIRLSFSNLRWNHFVYRLKCTIKSFGNSQISKIRRFLERRLHFEQT